MAPAVTRPKTLKGHAAIDSANCQRWLGGVEGAGRQVNAVVIDRRADRRIGADVRALRQGRQRETRSDNGGRCKESAYDPLAEHCSSSHMGQS